MGKKRRRRTKQLNVNDYWPEQEKKHIEETPKVLQAPNQPREPLTEQEKEQQKEFSMKLMKTMVKYDITERNIKKATLLWEKAVQVDQNIPNPRMWVVAHEILSSQWASLKKQAKESENIPEYIKQITEYNNPLRKYMEYMKAFFDI